VSIVNEGTGDERMRVSRSEHGAEGGAAGFGSVRHVAKKKYATTGYSHHRPRSENSILLRRSQ